MGLFSLHLLKENAVFSPLNPFLAHRAAFNVSTDWIIFLNLQTQSYSSEDSNQRGVQYNHTDNQ